MQNGYFQIIDYIQNMQRLNQFAFKTVWYFAFGAAEKSSLSTQFCRQNSWIYLKDPSSKDLEQYVEKDLIIQGSAELFGQVEKIKPELNVIAFSVKNLSEQEKKIRKQYRNLCRCIDINQLQYSCFRKAMYPNLIFIYGPNDHQNHAASTTLAQTICYSHSILPKTANDIISCFSKVKNYVINGLFTNQNQINILNNYFKIKIIHLIYKREDMPDRGQFFDKEFDLLPFLKGKQYYVPVKGDDSPITVMNNVGVGLCPNITYVHYGNNQEKRDFVQEYLQATDGVILDTKTIVDLLKRKNLAVPANNRQCTAKLTQILYRNLCCKQVLICGHPENREDFVALENINRPLSRFIDLSIATDHKYSEQYSSQIHYLENQFRITPNPNLTLADSLKDNIDYWIVNGTGSCGKTTIAKFIASQFDYKLIQFETECAAIKQKLANPDEGDQVPARKFIAYFGNLIKSDPSTTYIFDCLPYEKSDLEQWVKVVGIPHIINLKVDNTQQIKRGRKKAQGDVNAEITQQDTAKANQASQKNTSWIEKLEQISPVSKIYQVDYKLPQLLAQSHIHSILRPRIFLVQKNNNLVYQNIALKNNMGFINLRSKKLRQVAPIVRKCDKRDIILCGYGQDDQAKLVSQDLYWIQKNLGQIRYLGIWQPEQKQVQQKKLHLQRPKKEQKPKKAEGEQGGQQQPPAEQGEQGTKKKALDIYQFEWTEPVAHKNLSQWFLKLKKNITERTQSPQNCYDKFSEVLDIINQSSKNYVYETIK